MRDSGGSRCEGPQGERKPPRRFARMATFGLRPAERAPSRSVVSRTMKKTGVTIATPVFYSVYPNPLSAPSMRASATRNATRPQPPSRQVPPADGNGQRAAELNAMHQWSPWRAPRRVRPAGGGPCEPLGPAGSWPGEPHELRGARPAGLAWPSGGDPGGPPLAFVLSTSGLTLTPGHRVPGTGLSDWGDEGRKFGHPRTEVERW